ncbi:MAG: hypothetical protein DRO05_01555 [Thermoproteota archaeon]|nr:MAG: hypothetical protein DRO05_01555 [Candidatus Korarchaeota archaeon]
MRAESLKLTALFLAAIILLTTTLTRLTVTLPETLTSESGRFAGNPAYRTPVAVLFIGSFLLLLYALGRQRKNLRYLFAGEGGKKRTWFNVFCWLFLLLLSYYFIKRPPKAFNNVTNNTSVIMVPPARQIPGSPVPELNESSTAQVPSAGWEAILTSLPILAVFVLIAVYLSSEKLVEVTSPKRVEPAEMLEFVELSGNPREIIIRAYRNAVVFLTRKGLPYRDSWTHREHEAKVVPSLTEEGARSLSSLASLFEIAKYSHKEVDRSDVSEAIGHYMRLVEVDKGEES